MFPQVARTSSPQVTPAVAPQQRFKEEEALSEHEVFAVKVHSELTSDIDYDHNSAMELKLKDCSDEQLIAELARRKVDIQVTKAIHKPMKACIQIIILTLIKSNPLYFSA